MLYRNLYELTDGMHACMERKSYLSSLVLFFSAVDTLGWLDSDDAFATKTSFVQWVERYLLPCSSLRCTALDLYAARCGLLHTFSPESALASRGEARRICWAFGGADPGTLGDVVGSEPDPELFVTLHVSDLHAAWLEGLQAFLEQLDSSPTRASTAYSKADAFYSRLDTDG
jgi:hypothetical protein